MNPLIVRGIRERLRFKNLISSGLFSLILCSTLYLATFLDGMQTILPAEVSSSGEKELISTPMNGAREAFTVLLILQGFYLMFLGTGRVASVTAEEKETGLLDYQRMTPMSPPAKILGYLFGLPAREYFMFFLTLPFLIHCAVVGEIPLLNLLHLYAVFFSSVILYHLTAHVIGMVVSKPRAASWVARISVLGLYIFLPVLGQAGISFCPSSPSSPHTSGRFSLTCLLKELNNWEDLRVKLWPSGRRFLFHHNGFPHYLYFWHAGTFATYPFLYGIPQMEA